MKRFFLCMAVALVVMTMQAQPKWGTWSVVPHVGVSFANFTGDEIMANPVFDKRVSHAQTRIGRCVSSADG